MAFIAGATKQSALCLNPEGIELKERYEAIMKEFPGHDHLMVRLVRDQWTDVGVFDITVSYPVSRIRDITLVTVSVSIGRGMKKVQYVHIKNRRAIKTALGKQAKNHLKVQYLQLRRITNQFLMELKLSGYKFIPKEW